MAVIHRASVSPSKAEIAGAWLDGHPWGRSGPVEMLGGYRFDDPDGEVGVEGLLLRRDGRLLQIPVTYRAAALAGAEAGLVGRTEHSVLGSRWVYHASADPVAVGCLVRALRGDQQQESHDIYDGGVLVDHRPPSIVVTADAGPSTGGEPGLDVARVETPDGTLLLPHVLDGTGPAGTRRLVARVGDSAAVVAVLR